jgi:long-chain acyl-CoA synthetase
MRGAIMDARPWHQHYDPGVPSDITVEESRLDELLRRAARTYPETKAIVFFGKAITYRELDDLVDRFAAGLQRMGVVKGDRVSVFMPNCPQAVIVYEAVWRVGAIAVPSNPLYTAAEFAHQATDAGSKVAVVLSMLYDRVYKARPNTSLESVIVTNIKEYMPTALRILFTLLKERREGHHADISGHPNTYWFQDVFAPVHDGGHPSPATVPVGRDDTAVLMYTGGTTGVPKGAELSHGNLLANTRQIIAWSPNLVEGKEVMLTALPLTHSYSMTVSMNHSIARGYTQVIVPDPRDLPRLLKTIHEHRPTLFPGVPTLYNSIANHDHVKTKKVDLSSINYCLSGAAGLPAEVQRAFHAVTGASLVEGYGLSEASPVTHCNPLDGEDRLGTIGLPLPGTDVRILDEDTESIEMPQGERGVLVVSGPQVMKGYWNMPVATKDALQVDEDGRTWLHTGDVAVMDEGGYFRIVDRKKDLILAGGGFNVYPREIEDVLYEHPDVLEAGVIGVPVDGADQRVKAFVVLREGHDATVEDIVEFCSERLARFKVPREVAFRADLPKTFVGKVLRRELMREEREEAAARE